VAKMMKGNVARMLTEKPESRKPIRRPKDRWEKILKYIMEEKNEVGTRNIARGIRSCC